MHLDEVEQAGAPGWRRSFRARIPPLSPLRCGAEGSEGSRCAVVPCQVLEVAPGCRGRSWLRGRRLSSVRWPSTSSRSSAVGTPPIPIPHRAGKGNIVRGISAQAQSESPGRVDPSVTGSSPVRPTKTADQLFCRFGDEKNEANSLDLSSNAGVVRTASIRLERSGGVGLDRGRRRYPPGTRSEPAVPHL